MATAADRIPGPVSSFVGYSEVSARWKERRDRPKTRSKRGLRDRDCGWTRLVLCASQSRGEKGRSCLDAGDGGCGWKRLWVWTDGLKRADERSGEEKKRREVRCCSSLELESTGPSDRFPRVRAEQTDGGWADSSPGESNRVSCSPVMSANSSIQQKLIEFKSHKQHHQKQVQKAHRPSQGGGQLRKPQLGILLRRSNSGGTMAGHYQGKQAPELG